MLTPYQSKTQIFGVLKSLVLITFAFCLLSINIEHVYSFESYLDAIHKMQKTRIIDREQNNKQIQSKIKTYKKISKELRHKKKVVRQLKTEKFQLLETLIFERNPAETTLAQHVNMMRKNLDIIYRFIEKDYPIERSTRLKAVKNLQKKLIENTLSPSLMEEFYNILHNEINISQEDRVRTETIVIFNGNVEVVTFNVGRVGYYFINEEKRLAGLFSLKQSQWKLIDFKTYLDNFKNAIEIIDNELTGKYLILPVEVLSKTNVE